MIKIIASVLVLIHQVILILADGKDMSGIQINIHNPIIYMNNSNIIFNHNVPEKHDIRKHNLDTSHENNRNILTVIDKILRQKIRLKIVNGIPTHITDFPFSAYIASDCFPNLSGACTGSIISKWLILTAAHCIAKCEGAEIKEIEVYVGHQNWMEGEKIPVEKWHVHEGYTTIETDPPYVVNNDIAVLKLKRELEFSDSIQPVIIDKVSESEKSDSLSIAGWGSTELDNVEFGNEDLLYANLTIMDLNECKQTIQDLPPKTICAVGTKLKAHPYHGDSGAAAVRVDWSGNKRVYKQIGIHSLSDTDTLICVLVDLNQYYTWIRAQIKKYDPDVQNDADVKNNQYMRNYPYFRKAATIRKRRKHPNRRRREGIPRRRPRVDPNQEDYVSYK